MSTTSNSVLSIVPEARAGSPFGDGDQLREIGARERVEQVATSRARASSPFPGPRQVGAL